MRGQKEKSVGGIPDVFQMKPLNNMTKEDHFKTDISIIANQVQCQCKCQSHQVEERSVLSTMARFVRLRLK